MLFPANVQVRRQLRPAILTVHALRVYTYIYSHATYICRHMRIHVCTYAYNINIMSYKTQQYLALVAQFERKRPGGWCSIVVWRQRERLTHVNTRVSVANKYPKLLWKDFTPFRVPCLEYFKCFERVSFIPLARLSKSRYSICSAEKVFRSKLHS